MAIGALFNIIGIQLPGWMMSTVSGFSSAATPISFLALGSCFSIKAALEDRQNLIWAATIKLVVFPTLFLITPICLGWGADIIAVLLCTAAAPTASISYAQSTEMECDGKVAGEIVTLTTTFSILTMFLWIFFMKTAGLI